MIAGLIFNFFFGFLAGVILGWSKKAFFWVAVGCALIGLILAIYIEYELEAGLDFIRLILGIAITTFGVFCGERTYNFSFNEDK